MIIIPHKVKLEFIKRWNSLSKLSLEQFIDSICLEKSLDKKWWVDAEYIRSNYKHYIAGHIGERYPKLPVRPDKLLFEIIEESNKMINFK